MSTLHITSGDSAADKLANSNVSGDVLVWHDILYDGLRPPGWPGNEALIGRALFLEGVTGGGLSSNDILETLQHQYSRLADAGAYDHVVLWFDACLFDQSMLAHILTCMLSRNLHHVELLGVDKFPGIVTFHGLGQLQSEDLASLYNERSQVTESEFKFAVSVDKAFATQDLLLLTELSRLKDSPLPWVPAAVARWLQEQPDPETGLGRLESLALSAISAGCETPWAIFQSVAAADTPPQFWGDIILWAVINGLAAKEKPLVHISGPGGRLPQWQSEKRDLEDYRIKALV